MKCEKSKRLDFAEWVVGDTNDFLNLTLAETELVELKVKLALLDKEQIRISSIPESNIPKKMGSCQSRIFNIESGTTSVSIQGKRKKNLVKICWWQKTTIHKAHLSLE